MNPLHKTLKVKNAELPYEIDGSGHALILLHAGIADRRMWDAQVREFARHYQVVRYDRRGCGEARTRPTDFAHHADLLALLDALEIAQAHLVGLSFGGRIATDFTLEHPERVSALVLGAAGLGGFDCAVPAAEEAQFAAMDQLEEAGQLDALNEQEINTWVSGFHRPPDAFDPQLREMLLAMNMNNLRLEREVGRNQPLYPPAVARLAEISCPTLVLWGDIDVHYTQAASAALASGIAGAQQRIMPGVAHMLNLEAPAEFNAAVLEFLAAC